MSTTGNIVAERVKALRARLGLSQEAVSGRGGPTRTEMSKIEAGFNKLTTITMRAKLARGLGIDIVDLGKYLDGDLTLDAIGEAPREESIGERVLRARTRAGMTQASVSAAAGVDQTLVSKIEKGRTVPSRAILARVFEAVGVPADGAAPLLPTNEPTAPPTSREREAVDLADVIGLDTLRAIAKLSPARRMALVVLLGE